jgi:hypothetical protein
MLDVDPTQVKEPDYILASVPLGQKVAVPAVPAPQHSLLQRVSVLI